MASDDLVFTNYEVYSFAQGDWHLIARFPSDQRNLAQEEARRALATDDVLAVHVLRESYYPHLNKTVEVTALSRVKSHAKNKVSSLKDATTVKKKAKVDGFAPMRGAATPTFAPSEPHPRMPPGTGARLVGRALFGVAASLVLAGGLTFVVSMILRETEVFGFRMSPDELANALFVTFIMGFLLTLLPVVLQALPKDTGGRRAGPAPRKHKPLRPSDLPAQPRPDASESPVSPASVTDDMILDRTSAGVLEAPGADAAKKPDLDSLPPPAREAAQQALVEEAQKEGKTAAKTTAADPEGVDALPDSPAEASHARQHEQVAPTSEDFEAVRLALMRFVSSVITQLKRERPKLDPYTRFGLNLYLAGATEKLAEARNLPDADVGILMREMTQLFGSTPDLAKAFTDKYASYLMEPRYLQIVSDGRTAMERHLNAQGDPFADLGRSMKRWLNAGSAGGGNGIVTVLFTEVSNLDDLYHSLGDEAMRDTLRRHNQLVRRALAEYGGAEIKHTGTGIMASFPSAHTAIRAACRIQTASFNLNFQQPDRALHIRIGLNAGEPIAEEDDLFGSTVQLAARACTSGAPGDVRVSTAVRELARAKGIRFESVGLLDLKGFDDPVQIYRVACEDKDKAADTAAPDEG